MGGLAFSSGSDPLYTPRMPQAVYDAIRCRCHEVLTKYFEHVATPIEAPGKKDYGDVDFLVANPTPLGQGAPVAEILSKALSAERSISGKGSNTASYALPWPKDVETEDHDSNQDQQQRMPDKFVQVDVNACHSEEGWAWELFHHAHGDLWNILGSTIRKRGLTVNNIGLYLRIEEIDLIDRQKSMILLTKDPSEVLEFLGLDQARWWKRFASPREMFEYAATNRFFWADDATKEVDEDKKELKHNDRKRMKLRPVFRQWIEEFIPECRQQGRYGHEAPSRDQTRNEAFQRFGVQDEYERKLKAFQRERQTDEIWRSAIKGGVPLEDVPPEFRSAAIRGLKAIILEGDFSDGVVPPEPLVQEGGLHDIEKVIEFVGANWRRVGEINMEKLRARALEHMEKKKAEKNDRDKASSGPVGTQAVDVPTNVTS